MKIERERGRRGGTAAGARSSNWIWWWKYRSVNSTHSTQACTHITSRKHACTHINLSVSHPQPRSVYRSLHTLHTTIRRTVLLPKKHRARHPPVCASSKQGTARTGRGGINAHHNACCASHCISHVAPLHRFTAIAALPSHKTELLHVRMSPASLFLAGR